jgi:hypothetical protein
MYKTGDLVDCVCFHDLMTMNSLIWLLSYFPFVEALLNSVFYSSLSTEINYHRWSWADIKQWIKSLLVTGSLFCFNSYVVALGAVHWHFYLQSN